MGPLEVSPLSSAEIAAIASVCSRAAEWLATRDFERFLGFFADDVVYMPPNHPALEGKDAMRSWLQRLPKMVKVRFVDEEVEGIGGSLAFVREKYSMTFEDSTGRIFEDHGKSLTIWKKQPDGRWLAYRDIYNSDLAP